MRAVAIPRHGSFRYPAPWGRDCPETQHSEATFKGSIERQHREAASATMGGSITALSYQKRNQERVNVYIDGEFAFGLAAIIAARLKVGQQLTDDEIAQLESQDSVEKAYNRALNYLSYRPRSSSEIRRNLRKKGIDDAIVEAVIERLERGGLVDDHEFAHYWGENRLTFKPRGCRALRHELRAKGVPDAAINAALEDVDEEPAARQAAEAGARRLSRHDPQTFRRKLSAYLARRGFSYGIIKPIVDEYRERYEDT